MRGAVVSKIRIERRRRGRVGEKAKHGGTKLFRLTTDNQLATGKFPSLVHLFGDTVTYLAKIAVKRLAPTA
jgi:hypothetical protein